MYFSTYRHVDGALGTVGEKRDIESRDRDNKLTRSNFWLEMLGRTPR